MSCFGANSAATTTYMMTFGPISAQASKSTPKKKRVQKNPVPFSVTPSPMELRNEELMKQIEFLQLENSRLKNELGMTVKSQSSAPSNPRKRPAIIYSSLPSDPIPRPVPFEPRRALEQLISTLPTK